MKSLKVFFPLSILFLFSFVYVTYVPVDYRIQDDFTLKVKGTSNVHDWVSEVEELNGKGTFSFSEDGTIHIDQCNVSIPVKSLKSSKGSIMDKKTWKALDADSNPTINYELDRFYNVVETSQGFTASTTGRLTIAGKTQTINMKIKGKELEKETIEVSGSKALKMTDFGIDPPTALLGTMTTGDDITVEFRIVLDKY